jgi:hypothetical protein
VGSSRASRLFALALLTLSVPFAIRAANAVHGVPVVTPSYLPALEGPRVRDAFSPTAIDDLARMQPGLVVIGDSMAGTRIDPARLTELAKVPVAPILHAGSGPAYWYLVLKNWVIPSGIRPRYVMIFFRDTNLTNVMYRLDEQFRWMIDLAAHEREDELNAVIASATQGPWYRVPMAVDTAYGAGDARRWMEPAISGTIGKVLIPGTRKRTEFLTNMNARFGLDHLRPMEAADLQAAADREADFGRYVDRSVLPLMLRDARGAGLTLCFIRVQRRPVDGKPPYQSPALRRYVRDLKAYVESQGATFHDDTGDTAMTLDMYEDGDHIGRNYRRLYTEILFERLRPILQ